MGLLAAAPLLGSALLLFTGGPRWAVLGLLAAVPVGATVLGVTMSNDLRDFVEPAVVGWCLLWLVTRGSRWQAWFASDGGTRHGN